MKIWFQNHRYKMKKSRSDNKAFEMSSSLAAPRRVPVPVLVRDGKRCPSPSSLYTQAPEYAATINHHPTAFTSTSHNVHSSLMSAAAAHSYSYPPTAAHAYNHYAAGGDPSTAVSVSDSYLTNSNLAAGMSPNMASSMQQNSFPSYNPQLVQQNCRWPWWTSRLLLLNSDMRQRDLPVYEWCSSLFCGLVAARLLCNIPNSVWIPYWTRSPLLFHPPFYLSSLICIIISSSEAPH